MLVSATGAARLAGGGFSIVLAPVPRVDLTLSPSHRCYDEKLYWYTGDNCSGRISKVAMALGLVATILLLSCIILLILLVRNHRRKKYKLR